MIDDLGFLAGRVALFVGLAGIVGAVAGRFAWPHHRAVLMGDAWSGAEDMQLALDERDGRLRASRAEILQLRTALVSLTDLKDVEIGRLETAAIKALESMIATHRKSIGLLEEKLRAAESAVRQQELDLAEERNRTKRLEAALADRDALIIKRLVTAIEREASARPSP